MSRPPPTTLSIDGFTFSDDDAFEFPNLDRVGYPLDFWAEIYPRDLDADQRGEWFLLLRAMISKRADQLVANEPQRLANEP